MRIAKLKELIHLKKIDKSKGTDNGGLEFVDFFANIDTCNCFLSKKEKKILTENFQVTIQ